MTSTIKVNNIQNQCGANIINESSNTITIGASGDTIALASGASQTGFGRTGTVDWQTTKKTATFTAVNGEGYFVDTSGGAVTANLPAGSAGAIVAFSDYTRTFNTNNLTISPNGSEKIGGIVGDARLNVNGQAATFVYVDATEGWINIQETQTSQTATTGFIMATGGTETTCGNCKIHTFTGPGSFVVSALANTPACNEVSYLVVAGGGGSGSSWRSGAGGAGGFREDKSPITPYTASPLDGAGPISVSAQSYPITVGAGGTGGGPSLACKGSNGSSSVFSVTTSAGGGVGGEYNPSSAPDTPGAAGGSGGGGGGCTSPGTGGAGNTPPVSPPQGNPGGAGGNAPAPSSAGGGGGGATAAGTQGSVPAAGPGGGLGGAGAGTGINPSTCVGTPGPSGPLRYFAGGGGGGHYDSNQPPSCGSAGGVGGGGRGGTEPSPGTYSGGTPGTANTGGGGGGKAGTSGANQGGSGGSGIVIIRYKYQ